VRVLAVCAHPDDAEILAGGTLAKYKQRGDEIFIAITTNGEVGHPEWSKAEVARVRRQEAEDAAGLLGATLFWMGYPDEFLYDNPTTRLALINVIRQCQPDVILTHWPDDLYNPDHTVTGQMTNDVAIMTTVPNIETEAPPCENIPVVYFMDSMAGVGFVPDEYVDITACLDQKLEAIKAHESQVGDWLQDQYGGSILEMVEVGAKYRGYQSGVRYAEGFVRAKAWPRGVAGTLLPEDVKMYDMLKHNLNGKVEKDMITSVALVWKRMPVQGFVEAINGVVVQGRVSGGSGSFSAGELQIIGEGPNGPGRLELEIESPEGHAHHPVVITLRSDTHAFSFFLRDVNKQYPIYIPAYSIAVVLADDGRSYEEIEREVRSRGLQSELQRINAEPEESYEQAAANTRELPGQTWLGLSRDMRIFGVGFRGVGGEELYWDWVQPRFHGYETPLQENKDEPVRYRFLLGRGIGCTERTERRLEQGVMPILHAALTDDDITYRTTSFVSYERSELSERTLRGTHYLVADGYGHGHMLTPEQTEERNSLLQQEMNRDEETVLYFRAEAVNTGSVPRYAWFKNIVPNAFVLNNDTHYTFESGTGFVGYSEDRICCVSKLNGKPLSQEETAILVHPGESVVFEFFLPHRPINRERAEHLSEQSFEKRLEECRAFWNRKLESASCIRLPEKRLDEMVRAGLLHLDLVAYGLEPEGTIVPTIGAYTAIGSESSPIIQFIDSVGWSDVARRSLMFFLDKQHENGFIQNFGGYMLETGAALWCIGEHYRYTRDDGWIAQIKDRLVKAFEYIAAWIGRNIREELRGKGYGMLEGKTADPEDPFHSFMLNGYAYIGLSRLAEILADSDPALSANIRTQADELKGNIRKEFHGAVARSPVVPLADGSWVPTAPPWVEYRGPLSLYAEGGKWLTHGSAVARDSLLGPLYLVFHEVLAADEPETDFMLSFHGELMCTRNVAFSQPYYSIHPWVHLKRGEVKPFLKAYYNGFTGLADRETYSFWEHFWHASPHKTHEEGWFLMQTRWMLYMEEGSKLKLLPGIPRAWLEDGKTIELLDVASYFGPITLQVESSLAKGVIKVKVVCSSSRKPQTVWIRLPHPQGMHPKAVSGGIYVREEEAVQIDGYSGSVELELFY